jgi:hypothetical protein
MERFRALSCINGTRKLHGDSSDSNALSNTACRRNEVDAASIHQFVYIVSDVMLMLLRTNQREPEHTLAFNSFTPRCHYRTQTRNSILVLFPYVTPGHAETREHKRCRRQTVHAVVLQSTSHKSRKPPTCVQKHQKSCYRLSSVAIGSEGMETH